MSHKHNQPAQRTAFPGPTGPAETAFALFRHEGQWALRMYRVPLDVLEPYKVSDRGPDLFGMLQAQVEYELQKLVENGE